MAGLVPATPIIWHGRAPIIGVAGTSPAMTTDNEFRYLARAVGRGAGFGFSAAFRLSGSKPI